MRRKFLKILLTLPFSKAALAQSGPMPDAKWPTRPVRIIVPFAAGGSTDILARAVAKILSEELGQSFVIENRSGASGNIGAELVARAPADGHTLLFTSTNILMVPGLGQPLGYDVLTDFVPITMLANAPMVLFKSPTLQAQNVGELIADIRAKPGTYSFSSSGTGGSPHLAGELFRMNEGLNVVHVPYRGAAPALTDVASGLVEITFTTYISARPMLEAERLVPLAVASKTRTAALPDVPTFAEAGANAMDIGAGFCMFAPAGTPEAVVQKVYDSLRAHSGTPEFTRLMAELGADVILSAPDQFAQDVVSEVDRWKEFIPKVGIQQ